MFSATVSSVNGNASSVVTDSVSGHNKDKWCREETIQCFGWDGGWSAANCGPNGGGIRYK